MHSIIDCQNSIHLNKGPLIERFLFFLIGLSVSNGVVYVFQIGSTCVYIGYVVGAMLFGYLLLFEKPALSLLSQKINPMFLLFVYTVCLSLISCVLCIFLGELPEGALLVVLKGLIVFAVGVVIYLTVASKGGYLEYIMDGLKLGLLLNIAVSVAQFYMFHAGSFFTLYDYFPQTAYVVSAPWMAWTAIPEGADRILTCRVSGLFLEPSHYMVYLVCLSPLVVLSFKNIYLKIVAIAGVAFSCIASASPNILFFAIELTLIFAIVRKKRKKKALFHSYKFPPLLILFSFGGLLFATYFLVSNISFFSVILQNIVNVLGDLNVNSTSDSGTLDRWKSMNNAIMLTFEHPFGVGWNMESYYMQYKLGSGAIASHNFSLRMIMEIGLVGFAFYIVFMATLVRKLLAKRDTYSVCLGFAILFLFICQTSNGVPFGPWIWLLYGIGEKTSRI